MPIIDTDTPEGKAALKEQIEEAVAGLSAKNKELLAEVKEARKSRTIDPKEIEDRDNEIEALKGQLGEAQKTVKLATTEADKAKKLLEEESNATKNLLIENGLTAALTIAKVTDPAYIKASLSMLRGQVAITAEGDKRVAKIGDKDLATAVAEWAKSDEGNRFVSATQNTGGGASGGDGGGTKQTGNLGGTRAERVNALAAKFPELASSKG